MGVYFNPKNASFTRARNSQIFVDKTGLIEFLNKRLSTEENCIALSHARRFGKSHAAGMIDAYYSLGCDSSNLFDDLKISKNDDYRQYMNKYNVIHLDISSVWDFHKEDLVESIHQRVCEDLQKEYIDTLNCGKDLYLLLKEIFDRTGIPFVIIIDEWDCVIRNSKDKDSVHSYLQFLHSLFKSTLAMDRHRFDSYWKNTSSFASINTFITMNYAGLKDDIMTMLSGGMVMVDPDSFQNDLSEIHSKDDALTALIHLGYLGYDADRKSAYIPNYEVAKAFQMALKTGVWSEIARTISRCDELLMATIDQNADKGAEIIELAHETYTSVLTYNDENSL